MTETAAQSDAQVVSVDASGRRRTHFSGRLDDAVTYVQNNFPRPHVEPGGNNDLRSDVFVTSDGKNIAYHGEGSGGEQGWHEVDERGNLVDVTPDDDVNVDPTTVEE